MKKLGLILLVLNISGYAITQNRAIAETHLTTIPEQGILLNNGWKFHAGDDTAWADPNFDDSKWDTVSPAADIRDIPQIQHITYYWFRLMLELDSQLTTKSLGLLLSQAGASEIYLNGKLIYRIGQISGEKKNIETRFLMRRPFALQMDGQKRQVFAIRYAYDHDRFLIKYWNPNYCFNARLNTATRTFENFESEYQRGIMYEISSMCLWLVVSFITFTLYILYPNKRAYLNIAIYGFLFFLWALLYHLTKYEQTTEQRSFIIAAASLFNMSCNFFGFTGFSKLFNQKLSRLAIFTLLYGACSYTTLFFVYKFGDMLCMFFYIFINIEYIRIIVNAYRAKKPGAINLLIASLLAFVCMISMVVAALNNYILTAEFLAFLSVAFIAFVWGHYMAGEFARTGIALQNRVVEVEQLHKRTMEQEQEKQQLLSNQNEKLESEVQHRTSELNKSLHELKATQAQLIQSEKMASLGELTAGIAHEIQNPLNFVNNFSDVNRELLAEMKEEMIKGNTGEVKIIADDVISNEEKINHHGKRADAIVKGMLLHASSGSAKKEYTDINALAEEHLRMAYHGFRAKDAQHSANKSFVAALKTDFDTTIANVNIVPQDLGRVFLNLYTNAFHSVKDKQKMEMNGYEPVVSVTSKSTRNGIEISVADNGVGMSQKVLDKIFQPFFTTRPTGQGTGLGLSLSYDIIKSLGGEIKVETKEMEGSTFVVSLPVS